MIIYSQGGQCPYQAEGKIGNDYFYFRSRGNNISLELYRTKKDLEELENQKIYILIKAKQTWLTDEQAIKYIKKLYKKLKA